MVRQNFTSERGFLTFAQNNQTTDYLRLAYIQALSLKTFMPAEKYAVIVDEKTKSAIKEKYLNVFDAIITLPEDGAKDQVWKMNNEWKMYNLTPFRETIKLESDILFTRDISHWWDGLRGNEILLTTKIVNFRNEEVKTSPYRRQFLENNLMNVYNGFSYFRYSRKTFQFFDACKFITRKWDAISKEILKGRFEQLTTDVMYALAAKVVGENNCTNHLLEYPKFVHMKGGIYGEASNDDWTKRLYDELDDNGVLRVGFTRQIYPFHYYQKHWITDKLEEKYERCYRRIHERV